MPERTEAGKRPEGLLDALERRDEERARRKAAPSATPAAPGAKASVGVGGGATRIPAARATAKGDDLDLDGIR